MRGYRTALPGLCLLAALGLAPESAWPRDRAEEDVEFVNTLLARNYLDLADDFTRQLVDAATTPAGKADATLARVDVLIVLAAGESEVAKARAYIDRAIDLLRDFVKDNPDAPESDLARATLARLQTGQAQFLLNAMRQ